MIRDFFEFLTELTYTVLRGPVFAYNLWRMRGNGPKWLSPLDDLLDSL